MDLPTSFSEWVSLLADIIQVIGLAAAIIGLFWTKKQVELADEQAKNDAVEAKAAAIVTKAQFMFMIDQSFDNHAEMRHLLNQPGWTPRTAKGRNELRRYSAVFERVGILFQWELIERRNMEQLYLPRFRTLLANAKAYELLTTKQEHYANKTGALCRRPPRMENILRFRHRRFARASSTRRQSRLVSCAGDSF